MEFLQSDTFLLILAIVCAILLIGFIANTIMLSKIKRENSRFMKKFGKDTNIKQDLAEFIKRIEKEEEKTETILGYCRNLENRVDGCIQKVGIVRYSAFKDTGSDLSFALALLDSNNNGTVLNGIYSREMSNIYAKPIENGTSSYTLSAEEKEALQKAMKK